MDLWREIVESLPQAVIVLSRSGEPIAVNPAAETLLGMSQIARARIARLMTLNGWLAQMVEACLKTGQSLDNPEIALVLEKRRVKVRAEVTPLLGPVGEAEGAIVLLQDVSHQRGLEPADREHQRDHQMVRLSPSGLAHEVKNPLTGIKGATELLAAMFQSDERARQYCALILQGVNRIASLVEQVLAVSGPGRLKRAPLNIHQVLHEALRMAGLFEPMAQGVAVEQLFDPSLPELSGDAAALERAFLNLLRNAIEAVRESPAPAGPKIRIRTAMESQFRLSAKGKRRQFIRVEISDNGIGMASEDIDQLFAPFFTTKANGTGLGLVLSQRTIALHGGKLWGEPGGGDGAGRDSMDPDAASRPRGMTFFVLLPFDSD
jgi:two-component system nitrogen regulation sensor histidine kinase GlnL